MRFVHRYLAPTAPEQDAIRDAINRAVRGSHLSTIRVWISDYDPGAWLVHPVVDPTGWDEVTLFETSSGQISEKFGETVSRELTMTIASEYWQNPFDVVNSVSPYHTMIAVARGVDRAEGDLLVPLGVYRVRSVNTGGSAEGPLQIGLSCYSMEVDLRDARFLETPTAGTGTGRLGVNTIEDILHRLVEQAFPNTTAGDLVPFDVIGSGDGLSYSFPNGAVLSTERDRLDLILALQEDRNVWGRFDRANHYSLDTMPSVLDTPQPFDIDTGETGVLVSYGKEYTRDKVYNAVLAFGEYGGELADDPQTQVSFLATDTDPLSPTYWDGPYGRVPRFQRVGFLPNDGPTAETIVEEAAWATLARSLDFRAGINFESVPNPLLEAGDVIRVIYPSGHHHISGVEFRTEIHLIAGLTIGLGADTTLIADTVASIEEEEET